MHLPANAFHILKTSHIPILIRGEEERYSYTYLYKIDLSNTTNMTHTIGFMSLTLRYEIIPYFIHLPNC